VGELYGHCDADSTAHASLHQFAEALSVVWSRQVHIVRAPAQQGAPKGGPAGGGNKRGEMEGSGEEGD